MATYEPNPNDHKVHFTYTPTTGTTYTSTYTTSGSNTGTYNPITIQPSTGTPNTNTHWWDGKNWQRSDTPWFEVVDPPLIAKHPLWSDGATVKATLLAQLEMLQSFEEGLTGPEADAVSDAIFYVKEAIEALEKIIS